MTRRYDSFGRRSDLPRFRSRHSSGEIGCGVIVVVFILLGILAVIASPFIIRSTEDHVTFTVDDKDRVCDTTSDGSSCRYLVFTDKGVYEVTDSLAYFRWNSSDVYGSIKRGRTYEAKVAGWRIPFTSSYKNILEVDEVRR